MSSLWPIIMIGISLVIVYIDGITPVISDVPKMRTKGRSMKVEICFIILGCMYVHACIIVCMYLHVYAYFF